MHKGRRGGRMHVDGRRREVRLDWIRGSRMMALDWGRGWRGSYLALMHRGGERQRMHDPNRQLDRHLLATNCQSRSMKASSLSPRHPAGAQLDLDQNVQIKELTTARRPAFTLGDLGRDRNLALDPIGRELVPSEMLDYELGRDRGRRRADAGRCVARDDPQPPTEGDLEPRDLAHVR